MDSYLKYSRSTWYSLVFIMPLVVIYEVLAIVVNWNSNGPELRNGADIVLRFFMEIFGFSTPLVVGVVLALAVGVVWYIHEQKHGHTQVSGTYLTMMLLESLGWALGLLIVLAVSDKLLIMNTTDKTLESAYLAIGAGLYEEAVFRLLIVSGLAYFFMKVMVWKNIIAWIIAVLIGAVLFSGFHYLGFSDELFEWNSFVYRGVGGIFLGAIFASRGFGITVYAHTFYDLIVLTIRTVN